MGRLARIAGTVLVVAGLGAGAWALVVWQWQDPFTALYTKYEQHKLASSFARRFGDYRPPALRVPTSLPAEQARVKAEATAYRRALHEGQPVGRLVVPRLGLRMIVVNGTSHDDLTKGPGRELHTFMPGQDELVYVAGHRTTYLAPFAHIEKLRAGDRVTFELPYASFEYRVTGHRVVAADDVRPPLPPPRAARPAGLPPALLRDAPLHRLREARPRHPPGRPAVHGGLLKRQVPHR